MMEMVQHRIDGALRQRVLERVGFGTSVDIREEQWDLGFCDTCSSPDSGFSVHVDGVQVWPDPEYLEYFGGVVFADREGGVDGGALSSWGQFDNWLNGVPAETAYGDEDE